MQMKKKKTKKNLEKMVKTSLQWYYDGLKKGKHEFKFWE